VDNATETAVLNIRDVLNQNFAVYLTKDQAAANFSKVLEQFRKDSVRAEGDRFDKLEKRLAALEQEIADRPVDIPLKGDGKG